MKRKPSKSNVVIVICMTQLVGILVFVIVTVCIIGSTSSEAEDGFLFGSWYENSFFSDGRNLSAKVLISSIIILIILILQLLFHAGNLLA